MIRSLILALAIVATATALPNTFDFRPDAGEDDLLTEPPPICPPPGLEVNATTFVNHYNCSTYWLCESGVPTLKACPPGLNFNVILGVCDFPWATTCDIISPVVPADQLVVPHVNAACHNDGPPTCPPPGGDPNANATICGNPFNCSTYYYCTNGVAVLRSCAPSLEYNAAVEVCDFVWAANCVAKPPPLVEYEPTVKVSVKVLECQPDGPPICPPPGGPIGNVTQCPNPYNCSAYYYCDNGVAKPGECPPELEFNVALGVCDFPWNANCVELVATTTQEPTEPAALMAEVKALNVGTHALECQPDGPPICPPPGGPIGNVTQCPNPYNCSAYYYCDNGVAKPADCPPELEFNAALGVCDFPWNANCVEIPEPVKQVAAVKALHVGTHDLECQPDGPPICPPPGGPIGNVTQCPNPYNCSAYYYCDNGVAKPGECPPELEFNVALGVCDFPWNANCVELVATTTQEPTEPAALMAESHLAKDLECQEVGPPICPPPGGPTGNVTVCPNHLNCSMYYYCDNGFPHNASCPPDLEFNAALGVCDFPWNANCVEVTTTTEVTTTETTTASTTEGTTSEDSTPDVTTTDIPTETTTGIQREFMKHKFAQLKHNRHH